MFKFKTLFLSLLITILGSCAIIQELVTKPHKCVPTNLIMGRAQQWVKKKIPYSPLTSYEGYRTDCSGFVAMCWGLNKPGLSTKSMHTVTRNIAKQQLREGDAMNCDSKHILLFAGWLNSAKTHYYAIQQANSRIGTVKRITPYPYWNKDNCFHPIRFNNVC